MHLIESNKSGKGGVEDKDDGCMGITVKNVHLCTDIDSPEIILFVLIPLVTLYIFLTNNYDYGGSIIISIIYGMVVYISITLIKNIIASVIKSDSSCKIPDLNRRSS